MQIEIITVVKVPFSSSPRYVYPKCYQSLFWLLTEEYSKYDYELSVNRCMYLFPVHGVNEAASVQRYSYYIQKRKEKNVCKYKTAHKPASTEKAL